MKKGQLLNESLTKVDRGECGINNGASCMIDVHGCYVNVEEWASYRNASRPPADRSVYIKLQINTEIDK